MDRQKRRRREHRLVVESLEGREVLSAGMSGALSAMAAMHSHGQVQTQTPQTIAAPAGTALSGRLAASFDNGSSSEDGITSLRKVVFEGKAAPNAQITLHAQKLLRGPRFVVGKAKADANGDWRITSGTLGLGKYTIHAMARANGATRSVSLYGFSHPIVIVPG